MTGKPIRAQLMSYFERHPGTTVYRDEIAKDLDDDPIRVQKNIATLVSDLNFPLETVVRGQAWRYRPNGTVPRGKPATIIFERIGTAKDGSLILECEDGRLYRAVEL